MNANNEECKIAFQIYVSPTGVEFCDDTQVRHSQESNSNMPHLY